MTKRKKEISAPTRWNGPLKWIRTGDRREGTGIIQSFRYPKNGRIFISIGIEEGNVWSAALERTSGANYAGEIRYVANQDEMNIDPATGALERLPETFAQITLRVRKATAGLRLRGTWVDDSSGEAYTWKSACGEDRRQGQAA